jgi:hypothetical protein
MSGNDEFAWFNIDNHRGAGTWLEEMRARGFAVPLALSHGVSQAMEALAVSFPEAFRVLRRGTYVLAGHPYCRSDPGAPALHLLHRNEDWSAFR